MICIGDISTDLPVKMGYLIDIKIEQAFDSHGRVFIKGVLKESENDEAIHDVQADSVISVKAGDTVLFRGIPTSVKTKNEGGLRSMELELMGLSKRLDVKRRSRSFQDIKKTFDSLFKEITYEYDGDAIDFASNDAAVGVPLMQYEETDWEFMRRLASRLGAFIYPFVQGVEANIFIGTSDYIDFARPQGFDSAEIKCFEPVSGTRRDNSSSGYTRIYRAESTEDFQIGEKIAHERTVLVIARKVSRIKGGVLTHDYTFIRKEDAICPLVRNRKIVGMSAEGRVLEVSEDTVKLHLAADETQDIATAFPFRIACPYTAEGQTGWHVMPEKGEYASLYFPADDEGGAYVRLQSARRAGPGNEKHEHPAIKRFETVHGNEMKFSPDTLSFARPRSGNLIRMTDSGGVEIYSADTLQIRAGEKAGFACKTLNAVAGRSMRLGGKTATLIVDEILHLKG